MKKLITGAFVLLVSLVLAGCFSRTVKLTRGDAAQLEGRGLIITVIPPPGVPDSDSLWDRAQLGSQWDRLQMVDPAIAVKDWLAPAIAAKYHTTSDRGEYKLIIQTRRCSFAYPTEAGVVAVAVIWMKLISPSGEVIARDQFWGTSNPHKFPISPSFAKGNGKDVRLAFASLSKWAAAKFFATLSGRPFGSSTAANASNSASQSPPPTAAYPATRGTAVTH